MAMLQVEQIIRDCTIVIDTTSRKSVKQLQSSGFSNVSLRVAMARFTQWYRKIGPTSEQVEGREDFFSRVFTYFQEETNETDGWYFYENPFKSGYFTRKGTNSLYFVDIFDSAIGVLQTNEYLGTDGLFDCIGWGITGFNDRNERIYGLTHQNFFWHKDNPNIDHFLEKVAKQYRKLQVVFSFESEEREAIERLLRDISGPDLNILALDRNNDKNGSVGECVVTQEGVVTQFGKRHYNQKTQVALTWGEVNNIFNQLLSHYHIH